ncbi:hypothetical protein PanWU01x14_356710 [Parasponia andersonii]|uniref:Uncharacterized protein n=1 Tax=Parasponia andersonii TaxID=3476 RepID=A0A2P5A8W5_PARAD|nr:hypothetical protein PanWU01x14_356710 [Parasponia andersonii]
MARTRSVTKKKKETRDFNFESPPPPTPLLWTSARLEIVVEGTESSPILISIPVTAKPTTWKKRKFVVVKPPSHKVRNLEIF